MYLCSPFEKTAQFIDNIERHKEVKKRKEIKSESRNSSFFELLEVRLQFHRKLSIHEKETKSERRMPRLPIPMKDVVSCEKARGSANRN